jgi:hypothetical protein
MAWYQASVTQLTPELLDHLYELYYQTYFQAGQTIWFTSPHQLTRYHCSFLLFYHGPVDQLEPSGFIMYQEIFTLADKVSLFGYDQRPNSKTQVLQQLINLLKQPGFVIEAAGAVSWSLRKAGLMPFRDLDTIEAVLNIKSFNRMAMMEEQTITLNPNYRDDDKNQQVYQHSFINKQTGVTMFSNAESLFGTICQEFDSAGCDRACLRP